MSPGADRTESAADLVASRARVLAAADADRRQLQDRLHGGAQQRLTHAVIVLRMARAGGDPARAAALVDEALTQVEQASRELRDVVHVLLPRSLAYGGLRSGLQSLVDELAVPVRLTVTAPRLTSEVETNAYLVVAGALEVLARAGAGTIGLDVLLARDCLTLDLLAGGATLTREEPDAGLTGVRDRVLAVGGVLSVAPVEGGAVRGGDAGGGATLLHVELPVDPGPQPVA